MKDFLLFGLPSGYDLAKKIAFYLQKELSIVDISHFKDGEIMVRSKTSVRGKDVFLIQTVCTPVNEKLMELLITIDSFKRAGAKSINVISPYIGYSRQDRKSNSREPITFKLIANMISVAGATHFLTIDIHSLQTIGFFDILADNITTTYHFYQYLKEYFQNNHLPNQKYSLIAPDHGSLPRVLKLFNLLKNNYDLNFGFIDKRRNKPNEVELGFVLGDVENRHCFIIDDLIDTGGTIIQAAKSLKNKKALDIEILATHGLFSGPAITRFNEAYATKIIKSVVITDTIPSDHKQLPWLSVISLSYFLSKLIKAFVNNESLTSTYQCFINEIK